MDRNDVMFFDGGEADEVVHGFISDCKWLIAVGIVLAMGRLIVYKEEAPLRVYERQYLVCCYRPVCYVDCWASAKPLAVFVSVLARDYSSTCGRLLQYLQQITAVLAPSTEAEISHTLFNLLLNGFTMKEKKSRLFSLSNCLCRK